MSKDGAGKSILPLFYFDIVDMTIGQKLKEITSKRKQKTLACLGCAVLLDGQMAKQTGVLPIPATHKQKGIKKASEGARSGSQYGIRN